MSIVARPRIALEPQKDGRGGEQQTESSNKLITPQQEETEKKQLVLRERQPYVDNQDWLANQGYAGINQKDIHDATEMYRNYATIRTAHGLNASNLANGGLTIQVGEYKARNFKTRDLMGKTIMNWLQKVLLHFYLYGFAICSFAPTSDELKSIYNPETDSLEDLGALFARTRYSVIVMLGGEEPVVLPLEQLIIEVKTNVWGERNWVVRQRPRGFDATNDDYRGRLLPHIYVFTMPGHEPDSSGNLHSIVLSVRSEYQQLQILRQCDIQACLRNATPAVITERVNTDSKDRMNLHGMVGYHGNTICSDVYDNEEEACTALTLQERLADRMLRIQNRLSPDQYMAVQSEAQIIMNSGSQDYPGPRVDLPMDRKLARQVASTGPGELLKREVHLQEKILAAFGIPPAMLLSESTSGRSTLNTNAAELYTTTLANLKQTMMTPVEVMLRVIYGRHLAAQQLVKQQRTTIRDLRKATNIRATLPGIPPEQMLAEWFQMGLLKYEAYINYLSAIHCVPREDFNDEAPPTEMDLQEEGMEMQKKTLKVKEKQGQQQMQLKQQQMKQQQKQRASAK